MVLTEQSPSPAQLQRAAEAALLGAAAAHPLCPIPADAQPTMSQLMAVRDATRAALGVAAVQAAHAEQEVRPTNNYSVGMVAAAVFGALQGGFETVGKRILAAIVAHEKCVAAAQKKVVNNIGLMRKRLEAGDALEAKVASARAAVAEQVAAMLAKTSTKVLGARAASTGQPAGEGGERSTSTALVVLPTSHALGSAPSAEDAAQSLTALAGSSSQHQPRWWSCSQCWELRQQVEQMREAAEAAQQAERIASSRHVQAWSDLHRSEEAAEARRTQDLEEQQREHGKELLKERAAASKDARKEAASSMQELQRAAVVSQQHQHTATINVHHLVRELDGQKKKLGKSEAAVQAAKQAAIAEREKLQKEHANELNKKGAELQKKELELARLRDEFDDARAALKEAGKEKAELHKKYTSECVKRGLAEAKAQEQSGTRPRPRRDAERPRREWEPTCTLEQHILDRDRELAIAAAQLHRARLERDIYWEEVKMLERQLFGAPQQERQPPPRQQQQQRTGRWFEARQLRANALSSESPLEPYAMELLRRATDEANVSFAALAKAVPIIWNLYFKEPIPDEFLFSATTVNNAFLKLEIMDAKVLKARNVESNPVWAFASDGGNKGIAVNIAVVSVWDAAAGQPRAQPLACASLDCDQTARNSADTVNAALEASGLNPGRCVQGESDGCDAARNEIKRVLVRQHKLHLKSLEREQQPADGEAAQSAPAAPELPEMLSTAENCCIHAKALEERAFLSKAFPLFVDALRLLWEIIKGEGGRLEFYRQVWCEQAMLAPHLYESALAQVRLRQPLLVIIDSHRGVEGRLVVVLREVSD